MASREKRASIYADIRVKDDEYPEGEHPLETAWTLWFDKKIMNKAKGPSSPTDGNNSEAYMDGLSQLGTFNTVEGFFRHYAYLARPTDMPRDYNILCFRGGMKPAWEEFPEGGCWIIRIKRKSAQNYVNRMWESLLLATIGEAFAIPDVVGCVLSTRVKDDVLSIWNNSNENPAVRFRIGEKLKEILDLDEHALIQYKEHMSSIQDNSTYRNAKNYIFASAPSAPEEPVVGAAKPGTTMEGTSTSATPAIESAAAQDEEDA